MVISITIVEKKTPLRRFEKLIITEDIITIIHADGRGKSKAAEKKTT